MTHRQYSAEDAPTSMSYTNYKTLVHNYGVELIGWTEVTVCNPGTIQTAASLNRLVYALRNGDCYWAPLSADAWEEVKAARQAEVETGRVKKRKRRSDAGVSKKKKKAATQVKSAARVHDSDDEDDARSSDSSGSG
jgi:hypothetical protein